MIQLEARRCQPVRVRSGERPGSPVVKSPGVVERPGSKRDGINWPVRSMKRSLQRRQSARPSGTKGEPSRLANGEGHGRHHRSWSGCLSLEPPIGPSFEGVMG